MKLSKLAVVFALLLSTAGTGLTGAQPKYHNYDEMTREISSMVSSHKNISSVASLFKTAGGRDLWCVTVGGPQAGKNHAMLVVAGVEAERLIGTELALNFLSHLMTNYGKVDSVTKLLNSTTFYVVPRADPDASEQYFLRPSYQRTASGEPSDDDKDGLTDEDGYNDLDGDGIITMIRVRDDRGEWMAHPEEPRIMKKADRSKGEAGAYKIYTEGFDDDLDESWNEDPPGGTAFNRNFPHNYQYFSPGSGQYPLSDGAARAMAEFCFSHPDISLVFTFSGNENLMNPWKKEAKQGGGAQTDVRRGRRSMSDDEEASPRLVTSVLDDDEQYFNYFSKHYQDLTGFKKAPPGLKGEGAFNEWAYYHFGRWSVSADPWWVPEAEAKKDTARRDSAMVKKEPERKGGGKEEKPDEYAAQINALKWFAANGMNDRFVGWTKIKHKDFPDSEVEVGGFRPFCLVNPPPDSINSLAMKQNSFLIWLAAKLPTVEIKNVSVKSVGGKVFRVTASVVNDGYLPTNSAIGSKSRWPREMKISLGLTKGQKLAAGKMVEIIPPVNGSGGSRELTWLVISGQGEKITITAESPAAGSSTQTISLK